MHKHELGSHQLHADGALDEAAGRVAVHTFMARQALCCMLAPLLRVRGVQRKALAVLHRTHIALTSYDKQSPGSLRHHHSYHKRSTRFSRRAPHRLHHVSDSI